MKARISLAFFSAVLLAACGDTVENVNQMGMDVVDSVADLPECTSKNEGEQTFVKGETSARICVDGEWYATVSGGDSDFSCKTEELKDKSGLKIICNGDSIGVVLNGVDGKEGKQGETGDSGEKGDNGGCTFEKSGTTLTIDCGNKAMKFTIADDGSLVGGEEVVLDSEMVAVSLDSLVGYTQKGPFIRGATVYLYELSDGRTLKQTSGNFTSNITRDDGYYKFSARDLVSQYAMVVAEGYYRNEVTGNPSDAQLRLKALTDMRKHSSVNVNLLSHLEYDRVYYLVTREKMTVKKAKQQAQKEILRQFHIELDGNTDAEAMDVFGSSDADAALLAVSVMLQGDRSVAKFSELLTKISSDIEKDSAWKDVDTKKEIAKWCAAADSSGRLDTIRQNVEGWKLSLMVPKFEKHVRHFWNTEYGLGDCTADKNGDVVKATKGMAGEKTRYICKEIGEGSGDYRWVIASDFEKDTDGWKGGSDGEVKVGSITGTKYYLFDKTTGEWRDASVVEQVKGGCIENVAADPKKNTGFVNGYWYKCENREWVRTTAYIVDTQGWIAGSDGDVVKGDSTDAYYVFDLAENKWRNASENDVKLNLMGCTTNRAGEMGRSSYDNRYYGCSTSHQWEQIQGKAEYNTLDFDCDAEGKMVYGAVDTSTYFVCDAGVWREATTEEEQAGAACTAALNGHFNRDSTRICENKRFREANVYDFDNGVKNYFNPNVEYGTLEDNRDGRIYKTVSINGYTIMAENLNYAGKATDSYLVGQNWCYNDDTTNCRKGGRYYTWTGAMFIDSKWQKATVPEGTIKTPHQGICPDGWHIPTKDEWSVLLSDKRYDVLQAVGNVQWKNATNTSGFSALPVGINEKTPTGNNREFNYVGIRAGFCSVTEYDSSHVYYRSMDGNHENLSNIVKYSGISVRCMQDYE